MSALPIPGAPPQRFATPRRHLRAVADRTARVSRLPFLLVMATVLGVGLLGLVLLNTRLQDQAFEMRELHREQARLANYEAYLSARLDEAAAPASLAAKASALGMRADTHSTFLVVPDGTLIGEPTAVAGNELPSSVAKPPPPPPRAVQPGGQPEDRPPARDETADDEAAGEETVGEDVPAEDVPAEQGTPEQAAAEQARQAAERAVEEAAEEAAREPTPEERAAEQQAHNDAEAERARKAAMGEG